MEIGWNRFTHHGPNIACDWRMKRLVMVAKGVKIKVPRRWESYG